MIVVDAGGKTPLYQQLYEQIKQRIISGDYPRGKRLTSTRKLASDLCVGRNTVESAYEQLCVEGYVESRPGSGFTVMDISKDLLELPGTVDDGGMERDRTLHESLQDKQPGGQAGPDYRYVFRYGEVDYRTFPHTQWKKVTAKVLAQTDPEELYTYGHKQGEMPLRKEIAKYLHQSRGVRCTPEQVIMGTGFQDLTGIISLLLKTTHQSLAMEEPGYDFTRIIFENHGYSIIPVRVDASTGMEPDELEKCGAAIAYVTPSHQLPLGSIMPIQQRMRILQWARKVDGIILEDDYDSELRYRTRPIPSLQSIDHHERVIYMGTFSKAFAPGLRMGYMVLPLRLLPSYHRIFARYKSNVPRCLQLVAAEFMSSGQWEKHLRKICMINKRKCEVLVQTVQAEMGDRVRVHGQDAGLHILLEFNNAENQQKMVEIAAQHGVMVTPTRQFWHNEENAVDNLVMIGFGGLSEEEIVKGVRVLRHAWFD